MIQKKNVNFFYFFFLSEKIDKKKNKKMNKFLLSAFCLFGNFALTFKQTTDIYNVTYSHNQIIFRKIDQFNTKQNFSGGSQEIPNITPTPTPSNTPTITPTPTP